MALLALGIGYTVFQRKQIRLLNSQKALVSSMPIAYTEATVVYNDDGTMKNIEYNNSNEAFYKILHDNNLNSDTRRLFYEQNVASLIEHMKETHKPVRFNYYFKTTDRYYEIILSIPETHKREKMTKFHIFSVDVTDKSKVENELREFARKLDVTLNVARIILALGSDLRQDFLRGAANPQPRQSQRLRVAAPDDKHHRRGGIFLPHPPRRS